MVTVNHGKWLLGSDLDKIPYYGFTGPEHKRVKVQRVSQLDSCLRDLQGAVLSAWDIETNGEEIDKYYGRATTKRGMEAGDLSLEVKPIYITSISVSMLLQDGSILSYGIPFTGFREEVWSLGEFEEVIRWLRTALDLPTPKVFHNGVYDLTHLINYGAHPRNYVWDTMGAAHAEYAELPKALAFVASYLFPHYSYWKYKSKLAAKQGNIDQLLIYNMDDTYWTLMIAVMQMCATDNWVHINNAMTFKMVYPCMYSAFEGAKVDNKVRVIVLEEAKKKKNASLRILRLMAADASFNPGSWQQVEHLIYGVLGASKPKIGKSKSCTDEKNLIAVANQHPILARFTTEIIIYKKNNKAIGTYFRYLQKSGRLLYELNPWATDTGRMASRASNFNCGTQAQNIPSYGKAQLVPDEGFIWVNADFSKAEAVCTAFISCCMALIKAVSDEERDFYKNLAVIFFHFAYEDVSDEMRNKVMKKIVHGTNYMMGSKTFTENMGVENMQLGASILGINLDNSAPKLNYGQQAKRMKVFDFASFLINTYHSPFPEIRKWYKKTADTLVREGKIVSVLGWTRLFFGDPTRHHAVLRSAVAHQPQNLSVFLLNKAMRAVYDRLTAAQEWLGVYRLKGQIHDSIISQVLADRLLEALEIQKECMDVPVQFPGIDVPMRIKVDFEISTKSYKELSKVGYKNGRFILPEVF
jgi:DNA polymerase I-like protein with 3'-5' exonuclease and polymerase domains